MAESSISGDTYLFLLLLGLSSGLSRFQRAIEQGLKVRQEVLVSQWPARRFVMLKLPARFVGGG